MTRVYEHREPDRVPITDSAWDSAVDRWRREGLPADASLGEYFGWERFPFIWFDNTPRYEYKIIEDTDTYRIERDSLGQTHRNFKPVNSTPQYIDSIVKDPKTWQEAKRRMSPDRDRVDWDYLKKNYADWRSKGAWIMLCPCWSFDILSTRMCNSEMILYAMAENPEWVKDMLDTGADVALALTDMIWGEGYFFDEFIWYDDMAYRNGLLFSKTMWREMVRPYQKRFVDWAHSHGVKAHMHCCGNVSALIPDLLDMGIDALDPLEVKAGMDPLGTKNRYGDRLVLKGGFDVQHWSDPAAVEADIRRDLPDMMKSSGYIFASDHSIPESVSLDGYRRIVSLVKEVGRY
jgi:uroporphyrinogen decarboxylase